MAQDTGYLISLNGEYLYSAAHGGMYAPLRINESIANLVQSAVTTEKPDRDSCIQAINATWCNSKFIITTDFNTTTKCSACLNNPSICTKKELCVNKLCNGKCTDDFMRDVVAKNVLPELYNTKQK